MDLRMLKTVGRKLRRRDLVNQARQFGVQVGERCRFISTSSTTFGSEAYLISIGNHVTITEGVRFVTHDGGVWVLRDEFPEIDVISPIVVGNNVFIGLGTIVLPGVSIGDNVVVAAGSIVSRDVPCNCVVAGAPAQIVKTLENYRSDSLDRAIRTKGMPADPKRRYLLDRFDLRH